MKHVPSPNFNDRAAGSKITHIVLHYTDMENEQSAIERMCDPKAQVSAHYLIAENGEIAQLVDETQRAWHAGVSSWRGHTDMNSISIGIELANPGHQFGYRAFPQAQIDALKKLLPEIIARHQMNPALCLLAHSDIAPARKQDPGELFPWQELAKEGLGLWPQPQKEDYKAAGQIDISDLLASIGYEVVSPRDAVCAFQRRYQPDHLTGIPDGETIARLRALKRVSR